MIDDELLRMMDQWVHNDRRPPVNLHTTKGAVTFNYAVLELITAYRKQLDEIRVAADEFHHNNGGS